MCVLSVEDLEGAASNDGPLELGGSGEDAAKYMGQAGRLPQNIFCQ